MGTGYGKGWADRAIAFHVLEWFVGRSGKVEDPCKWTVRVNVIQHVTQTRRRLS